MRAHLLRCLVLTIAMPCGLVACPADEPRRAADALLVVGVQSDDMGTLAASVHAVVKRDGVVVHDETQPVTPGSVFRPKEIEVTGPPGARVEVMAEALPAGEAPPLVVRLASARLPAVSVDAAGKKLLRVHLESRCVVFPTAPPLVGTTTCSAPLTCIAGTCQSSEVDDVMLEDYEPAWAAAPPDICRPAKRGPPEALIGVGQTDYASLNDDETLSLERGPQGGHHVWIAARMKNLRQSGTTTTITSSIEGEPEPVPPASFVFAFERDEGAYCKVWGLRYQVDAGASDLASAYKRFLGKRLTLTVELLDSTGAKAGSTRTVRIAEKLRCPDGTDSCNL